MKNQFVRHNVFPVIAAFIWGMAFVAQSNMADIIEPFTMNAIRSIIAFFFLLVMYNIMQSFAKKRGEYKPVIWKDAILGGTLCGVFLFLATNLQQFGITDSSAGKAGFITSCYIVFVPILGIFVKKKCPVNVWLSVVIAVAGLYCLCVKEGFTVSPADILIFLCAVMFAVHIIIIDRFTVTVDGVLLSMIQFLVSSILSAIFMFTMEEPQLSSILECAKPLLYLGILSSGVAYTLQIISLKGANPTIVSLLMSFESVFAALGGAWLLGERLSGKEFIGCALMFCAVILAQLDFSKFKRSN